MDNIFRKFCQYYIIDKNPKLLEELQELAQDEFEDYENETKQYIDTLQKALKKLGYSIDFESFCNLLEEYINKKESLNDEGKREYLKVLRNLSELYEINLREELERYVTYKKEEENETIDENELFYRFCKYNIAPNDNVDEFNALKEIAQNNNIQFKELQKKSIMFVEELKLSAEHLGFDIEVDKIEYIVREYLRKKNKMSDYDKTRYLKILLYLSEIYEVNLREMLTAPKEQKPEIQTIDVNEFLRNISNPLDNEELLSNLLNQRYNNGYFEIRDTILKSDNEINDKEYDFDLLHANLTYKLYRIFIEKYNNYALEDLNEEYLNMISEEDIKRLSEITEDELYEIIRLISNRESSQYIIKKYKLSNDLYLFIEKSTNETTDIKIEHIGIRNNTLFTTDNSQYTIKLYLNGPEEETHKVLNDYIVRCVEENINYDMKATGDNRDSKERTILYANINDITKKVSILDTILEDNNLKQVFSTPIHSSGRINNSIYGISHSGVIKHDLTCVNSYNDYFNNICEVSYYRTISKIILDIIDDDNAKYIVQNFINLSNISFDKSEMESPELAEYNDVAFDTIKDLINQYIPLISSTLNIYMTDEEKNKQLVSEFKKSIMYISNICQGREKRFPSNIVINSYLEQFIKNN